LSDLTIQEIYDAHSHALEEAGWVVGLASDEDSKSIRLFARLKNGNQRKSPSIELRHKPLTHDLVVTRDGGYERMNVRPSARPWSLGVPKHTQQWFHAKQALEAFLDAAGVPTTRTILSISPRP
jgi:hypothetical protein